MNDVVLTGPKEYRVRRIVFSALVVCPPLAEFCPAQSADPPTSFAPQALVLTPEPPPEFPLPEKSRGEPLPAPQEKALLVEQALQLAPPPLTRPDEDLQRAQTAELFTAVAEGNHRQLLALLAAGADVNGTLPLPADVHCWIFNTHTKHALVDGLYAARHRECMAAARVLGVDLLVEADLARLETARAAMDDTVYRRARHVIEEIARVEATCTALAAGDLAEIGRLLTASHGSSRDWFDNSTPELDHLVELLTATAGVYGARLTGGGFGGAVMALTTPDFEAAAQTVAKAYAGRFGAEPEVLHLRVGPGAELLPSS
jgi:hypothetical protein